MLFSIFNLFRYFSCWDHWGTWRPPTPPAFFARASTPGFPRPSHSNHERCSNSKTVLFARVVPLKVVSIDWGQGCTMCDLECVSCVCWPSSVCHVVLAPGMIPFRRSIAKSLDHSIPRSLPRSLARSVMTVKIISPTWTREVLQNKRNLRAQVSETQTSPHGYATSAPVICVLRNPGCPRKH